MELADLELYRGALAYEAFTGEAAGKDKPFKTLGKGDQDRWVAVAKAVIAGVSGVTDATSLTAGPNAHALPTVDPVTGESLRRTKVAAFHDEALAARAGLVDSENASEPSGAAGGSSGPSGKSLKK